MRDLGSIQSPQNSFLLNLGLETLHLRMPQQMCIRDRRSPPRGLGERASLVKPQIKKILFFVGWSMSIRWEDINKYVLN